MSQPGLDVLLEVELLQGVELASASSHHVTVARDGISHVEVIYVLGQCGAVEMGLTVRLVSVLLEARGLDEVVLDQVGSKLGNSCSKLFQSVVRKRGVEFLRESTDDLPVVLSKARSRDGVSRLLGSSISVDKSTILLKIAGSGEDEISVACSFVSGVTLVNDEGIFRDLLVSEVVSSKKPDNLGRSTSLSLGSDSKLKSIDPSNITVEHVESVPVLLFIDKVGVVAKLVHVVHQGWCIRTLKTERADHHHREFGRAESLREGMSAISELLKGLGRVTKVQVVVGKLRSRANDDDLEAVDRDCLLDSCVENGVLILGVAANKNEEISLIDSSYA